MERVMARGELGQGEVERERSRPDYILSAYLPSGTALGEMTASATAFMLRRRSMAAR
jgi:hypothetical protein